ALLPHSKKVMGSIPAWGAVGSGWQVLPRGHSAQVDYLPGLSVWSLHVLPRVHSAQVGYLPGLSVWSLHVLPRVHSAQVGISRAFLCGVCMFSPCSQGVSSTKNPNSKNIQNNRTHVHP